MTDKRWKPFFWNMFSCYKYLWLKSLDLSRLLCSWCERKVLTMDLEGKSLSWLNHEHPVINRVGSRIAAFMQTDTFREKVQDNDVSSKTSSCLCPCTEASVLKYQTLRDSASLRNLFFKCLWGINKRKCAIPRITNFILNPRPQHQ